MLLPLMFVAVGSVRGPISELYPLLSTIRRIDLGLSVVVVMLAGAAVLILRIRADFVYDAALVRLLVMQRVVLT